MRKKYTYALFLATMGLLISVGGVQGAVFYVSAQGHDAGAGTATAPFATLGRAQTAVRAYAGKETVTVFLSSGTYALGQTLVFKAQDSGSERYPVTYRAAPKATVIFSGGQTLRLNWQPYKAGTMQAELPQGSGPIDQLFVNGQRRFCARWPNYKSGEHGVDTGYSSGLKPQAGTAFSQVVPPLQDYAGFFFNAQTFSAKQWTQPQNAIIHVFQKNGWGNMQWRLSGINYQENLMTLGPGGWQIGTLWEQSRVNWVAENSKFYVENVFEELDAPGEWYCDEQKRMLYYYPPEGENLSQAEVIGCGLKELMVFQGKAENPVKHIHFKGCSFQYSARTLLDPYETRLRGDWAIARRAAIRFDGAQNCSVTDCRFMGLGGNAVLLSNHNRNVNITDSLFTDIGDSAVLVVGSDDAVREFRVHRNAHIPLDQLTDIKPGPKSPNYPGHCRIHNNLMYRLGVFGKQVAGVYLSACESIAVSHNTICLVPRAAICINDGCWGGHVIEYNNAFLTVLETADHGPLNAWGRDRFWQTPHRIGQSCDMSLSRRYARLDNHLTTIIRNNRFVDSDFSWGIDLDDGASNYLVENNLCLGCSVKLREGYFRQVKNNIFVGPNPPNKHCCFEGSDDIYTHNIYVNTQSHWALNRGPATEVLPIEMDHNLYFNTAGKPPAFGFKQRSSDTGRPKRMTLSFADWQALDVDKHALITDPGFVDLAGQDYRLRQDANARKLGFQEFPLDRFGTQKDAFKTILRQLGLEDSTQTQATATYLWMGAQIRNHDAGILFVEVPASSDAYGIGFRAQDRLLQMNKVTAGNVEALIGMISGAPYQETPFLIKRGQQQQTILADGPGGVPVKKQ